MKNIKLFLIFTLVIFLLAPLLTQASQVDANLNANSMKHNLMKNDFQEGMMEMHRKMNEVKPTGNTDIDFVRGMIPHHQGAIDMAKIELSKGKDPVIRKLAADIIKAQEKEIAEMNQWLWKNESH